MHLPLAPLSTLALHYKYKLQKQIQIQIQTQMQMQIHIQMNIQIISGKVGKDCPMYLSLPPLSIEL